VTPDPPVPQPIGPERRTQCVRTGQLYDSSVHAACPYCFGSQADLSTGDRSRFCGFEPGRDPLNFGFPDGAVRERRA
jgi:hypothetical protein